jgi:hypothetical protein|tara:strand:- start:1587 stop:1913 length:327 start_codon:yes stop_codon:yes gene_type:complete
MASGTAGYNAGAYGDNGWDDGAVFAETGIAATLALGTEEASGSATINQVGYDNLRLSVSDLSENVTGTASVNTITGISSTSTIGTAKLWSLVNTTSGGTETWTTGIAN